MLMCRVCGREIVKGTVFITKHVRISGHDAWMPVHILCNIHLMAGTAQITGRPLPDPAGHAIGDGLMLPISH